MTSGDLHHDLLALLQDAKRLAKAYRRLTGRPLGVTGEVAEYEAARLLGLELASVRQAGYDAIRHVPGRVSQRLQVKGRCILDRRKRGQQVGRISMDNEWDAVVLVLLDEELETVAIYEASRDAVAAALTAPGSRARNDRGALAVSKFRSIGRKGVAPEAGRQYASFRSRTRITMTSSRSSCT